MSRGRGKVQQAILDVLAKHDWLDITKLVVYVYHPERFDEVGDCDDQSYTHGEFSATHRAVRALELRGLVETEVETSKQSRKATRDGIQRIKRIRLARR